MRTTHTNRHTICLYNILKKNILDAIAASFDVVKRHYNALYATKLGRFKCVIVKVLWRIRVQPCSEFGNIQKSPPSSPFPELVVVIV
ncbi:MAG: hypothetical protein MJ009_05685 [Paludibacteraceae bacterium]|nr:hypothetical protein [Paludibacteraceae bacterium]